MKIFFYTLFALTCFAFNSILCRLALGGENIDAAGFTLIRLVSGAATLFLLTHFFSKKDSENKNGNWPSAFFLFAYAICFSFAYINLTTGTGALILFSSVQFMMIAFGLIKGERPGVIEWIGLALALGGLIYLVFPGLAAPHPLYSALMCAAGIAWGFYTLRGRGSTDPLTDTAGNFLRSVPMIVIACIPFLYQTKLSTKGIVFAVLSGAVASGIGYSVWYAALKHHTATRAAILQLSVPVIAAVGGVGLLSETLSWRLVLASVLILAGIGIAVIGRRSNSDED